MTDFYHNLIDSSGNPSLNKMGTLELINSLTYVEFLKLHKDINEYFMSEKDLEERKILVFIYITFDIMLFLEHLNFINTRMSVVNYIRSLK